MHSSRMRTARSLTVSPYLVVSHACPPRSTTHPPEQPCMPPQCNHACPPLEQPCTPLPPLEQPCMLLPPWEQPYMPPNATMHAPLWSNHARRSPLWSNHACCSPPGSNHTCPPRSNHACPPWEQPRMPPLLTESQTGDTHAHPWTELLTHTSENITLPQLRCGR